MTWVTLLFLLAGIPRSFWMFRKETTNYGRSAAFLHGITSGVCGFWFAFYSGLMW